MWNNLVGEALDPLPTVLDDGCAGGGDFTGE
jgi:hypothetical protein